MFPKRHHSISSTSGNPFLVQTLRQTQLSFTFPHHSVQTNLRSPLRRFILCNWHLLPEENVPEKQPAGVDQQGYEGVNQRAVQVVIQDALRDDWQVKQPAFLEADGHLQKLLEEEDGKEECEGRAEDDQDEGWKDPEGGKKKTGL